MYIVNACARRLGSRAGPRTGKEERTVSQKILRHSPCRSHRQAGPSTATVCISSKRLGGVPQGGGGGGGGRGVTKGRVG